MELLSILRPMYIVLLATATAFRIRPRGREMIYMEWWRQIFSNLSWVEQIGNKIIDIGKDLIRLNRAIKTWDYKFKTLELRLLVVVKETLFIGNRGEAVIASINNIEARYALLASIHTSYKLCGALIGIMSHIQIK
jgi:hypothetical protein